MSAVAKPRMREIMWGKVFGYWREVEVVKVNRRTVEVRTRKPINGKRRVHRTTFTYAADGADNFLSRAKPASDLCGAEFRGKRSASSRQ